MARYNTPFLSICQVIESPRKSASWNGLLTGIFDYQDFLNKPSTKRSTRNTPSSRSIVSVSVRDRLSTKDTK